LLRSARNDRKIRGDERCRTAIDDLSNETLVTRFGLLWNRWDQRREALRPVARRYLEALAVGGFEARSAHESLMSVRRRQVIQSPLNG
jgi:hypothetical protein